MRPIRWSPLLLVLACSCASSLVGTYEGDLGGELMLELRLEDKGMCWWIPSLKEAIADVVAPQGRWQTEALNDALAAVRVWPDPDESRSVLFEVVQTGDETALIDRTNGVRLVRHR
jgi:hypothetical protein